MSKGGQFIYAIAKAINGPHYAEGLEDLDRERNRRWNETPIQQKRDLLQKARAAQAQMEANTTRAVALHKPREIS